MDSNCKDLIVGDLNQGHLNFAPFDSDVSDSDMAAVGTSCICSMPSYCNPCPWVKTSPIYHGRANPVAKAQQNFDAQEPKFTQIEKPTFHHLLRYRRKFN